MFKRIPSTKRYEVNENGQVRMIGSSKCLSPKTKSNGYLEVNLYPEPQKSKSRYIHRLVCEAFDKKYSNDLFVNHKDGNKKNNHISNLEMVTASENSKHAYKNKLSSAPIMRGELHPRTILKDKDVIKIRQIHSKMKSIKKLCELFPNLKKSQIGKIVYRETWKHI